MNSTYKQISDFKREMDAVILAHYYVNEEVKFIADYIGDSYYLAKIAAKIPEQILVFCGVSFMGESAKILNPQKTVLIPDTLADCPMAHMADISKIDYIKRSNPDTAVVCYVNSTAELKAHSDVCVTSSNALDIVAALPQKNIYFIPDENLGRYISLQLPQKHFILNEGYCHVHTGITVKSVQTAKALRPGALVLAHPECRIDVLSLADYIGSTSQIIEYATNSYATEFIICTEIGVLYDLVQKNPDKRFYPGGQHPICPNMKRINLEKVLKVLSEYKKEHKSKNEILLEKAFADHAKRPLERMLEMAK